MTSLSVIVASVGRHSLHDTLDSLRNQLTLGDEVLISINTDAPWGHKARNQLMRVARGNGLMFIDDDDQYVPNALELARAALHRNPRSPHLFRMRYLRTGRELWTDREVRDGNVSTQMIVAPNIANPARWGDRYQGDFDYIAGLVMHLGRPVWHEDVIALIGGPNGAP